jgi:DNA adenine methylase
MSNFLAWAGGKSQVMKHIAPHIPSYMRNYYEPFLGGGSVLLYILDKLEKGVLTIDGSIICADINQSLILTFDTIKTHAERVIQQYEDMCCVFEDCVSEDQCKKHYCTCLCKECYYHAIRTKFNAYCKRFLHSQGAKFETTKIHTTARIDITAQFLFLNTTCYRGLYRESKAGVMNSCFWTKRPIKPKSQPIREAATLFRKYNVQFFACTYEDFFRDCVIQPCNMSDFMIIDPPYIPQSHGDHISAVYHKDGFGDHDTENVIEWINDNAKKLSITYCNHATEEILAMCMDLWPVIKTYDVRRCLKYSGTANIASELLVSNVGSFDEPDTT